MSTARSAASVPLAASPEQTTTGIGSVVISPLQERQPVHLGHLEVQHDHVRPRTLHLLERDQRVRRRRHRGLVDRCPGSR
jgi:hypothetical protein